MIEARQAAFDPFDPDRTLAAAYLDIGLRISRDGGAWWEWAYGARAMNQGSSAKAYSVAYDLAVKGRLYVGSGQSGLPDIFRSDDGGRSFSRLHVDPLWRKMRQVQRERGVLYYPDVQRIVIDPSSPSDNRTLYAGFKVWTAPGLCGVYKSNDGGATWRESSEGLGADALVNELILDPSRPRILYAGACASPWQDGINGLFKTSDGGANWTRLAPDRISGVMTRAVTLCAAHPDTLYAAAFPPAARVPLDGIRTLFRSDDGGATWRALCTDTLASVAVNPVDPNWVYIARPYPVSEQHQAAGVIFRSKDGGETWQAIDDDAIPSGPIETNRTSLSVDPCDPRRLIVYTAYGLWIGFDPEAPGARGR